jgi:glycosyltransferase involved in cell wall biosynthesis
MQIRQRADVRLICAYDIGGRLLILKPSYANLLISETYAKWTGLSRPSKLETSLALTNALGNLMAGVVRSASMAFAKLKTGTVYLSLDHGGLQPGGVVERLAIKRKVRVACFLHDLIPITHPEYVMPSAIQKHEHRMSNMCRFSELIITNSLHTRDVFFQYAIEQGLEPPEVVVAPLGVDANIAQCPEEKSDFSVGHPYFVMIGTIEARKNHALILTAWRMLVEQLGAKAPRLVVVGRRGWEAESAFDMLDRCRSIRPFITERSSLTDAEMMRLVRGARALLFPSFAEGYGLPLAEALAAGVPVLASDIPAFREVGAGIPEYFSPIDGMGWVNAVVEYSEQNSIRRSQQMKRIKCYDAPTWEGHFDLIFKRILSL